MSRQSRHHWLATANRRRKSRKHPAGNSLRRALRFEPLEDRRLLAVFTVTNLNDAPVAAAGDAPGTLRQAIFDANHSSGADSIKFDSSLPPGGGTIVLTQGQLNITDSLTIQNDPSILGIVIDASGSDPTPGMALGDGSRVFNIDNGNNSTLIDVELDGMVLEGGDASGGGGAIRSVENLTLNTSSIFNNVAPVGGGIYSRLGHLSLDNVSIQGNTATLGDGGGISHAQGDLSLNLATVSQNRAKFGDGGGVQADFANVDVKSSTISGNIGLHGAGIWSRNGNLTISDSYVSHNAATESIAGDVATGGGIYKRNNSLSIVNSTVNYNHADGPGGGIYTRNADVTISGSKLLVNASDNGAGGGIYSPDRSLTITGSTLTSNGSSGDGGAVYKSGGTLSIAGSTIDQNYSNTGNGGGVFASATSLDIENSTFDLNNAARSGGAIDAAAGTQAKINNSTISLNFADQDGGAIAVDPGATATITFATITENIGNRHGLTTGSGGGIAALSGNVLLANSIVAANYVGVNSSVAESNDIHGAVTASYTLIGVDTGVALTDLGGNIVGTAAVPIDPGLGELANNGGPVQTLNLLFGSPAIDAGDPTAVGGSGGVPQFDQRGTPFNRVFDGDGVGGARVDMGAYEYQAYTLVVDTLADENDGDYSPGDFSLREALAIANLAPELDTIEFSPALTAAGPAKIVLTLGELPVSKSVSIVGPGADLLTIDAIGNDHAPTSPGGGSRIFNATFGSGNIDFNISGLTLTNADDGSGGAIFARARLNASDLVITNCRGQFGGAIDLVPTGGSVGLTGLSLIQHCTFTLNAATSNGGAIYIQSGSGGTVQIVDNTISNNTSSSGGGAIALQSAVGPFQLIGNTITGNKAARGGALYASQSSAGANLILTGNTITGNAAAQAGGAVFLQPSFSRTTIQNCTISGNTSVAQGGALFLDMARDVAIIDSTISNNKSTATSTSSGRGGGVYINAGDVEFAGCTVTGNSAVAGGGIWSQNGELAINFSTFQNNTATGGDGGGIFSSADRLSLTDSMISGNSATPGNTRLGRGGGLFHAASLAAPSTILNTSFTNNVAGYQGGGVYWSPQANSQFNGLTLTDVTISGNSAARGGGLVAGPISTGTAQGSLVTNGGSIAGNTATAGNGGGVYARVSSFTANGTTITGNRASGNGGGIAVPLNVSGTISLSFVDASIDSNVAVGKVVNPTQNAGDGGGLWLPSPALLLSLLNTSISGNSAGRGGGIFRGPNGTPTALAFVDSKISGNVASFVGGGLYNANGGSLSFTRTAIDGNSVTGNTGPLNGGGIFSRSADISLVNSSVSGNSSANGRGGGMYMGQSGDLSVTGSTIAGNFARVDGGGVWLTSTSSDRTTILNSTISGNSSTQGTGGLRLQSTTTIRQSTGAGGVSSADGSQSFELDHTIVAGNTATPSTAPDLRLLTNASAVTIRYSLIGDNSGNLPNAPLTEAPLDSPDVNGNLIGKPVSQGGHGIINPLLAALADNGGLTKTRALLPGSPAIDAGAVITGQSLGYDQRGNPFHRAVDGNADGVVRIDIGAYESQGVPSFSPGDFNRDGFVDASDYVQWRATLEHQVPPFSGADGNGNGRVDHDDYDVWRSHYGQTLIITPPEGGGSAATVTQPASALSCQIDSDLAAFDFARQSNPAPQSLRLSTIAPSSVAASRSETALLAWLSLQPNTTQTPSTAASTTDGADRTSLDSTSEDATDAAWEQFDSALPAGVSTRW